MWQSCYLSMALHLLSALLWFPLAENFTCALFCGGMEHERAKAVVSSILYLVWGKFAQIGGIFRYRPHALERNQLLRGWRRGSKLSTVLKRDFSGFFSGFYFERRTHIPEKGGQCLPHDSNATIMMTMMIPPLGIHHDHAAMMMMILQGIWESQVGTGMTGGGGMTLVAQGISIISVEYTRQSSSSNTLLILRTLAESFSTNMWWWAGHQ